MNKKIIIGIIIFSVLITSVTIFFPYTKVKESNIKSAIEKANYCIVESDCVDAESKCPFGCYVYVNKNEVEEISELIKSYDSKCVYDCVSCPTVICENQKCKEICK